MINELLLASQSVQALGMLLKAANGLSNYNEIVAAVSEVNAKFMQANAVALAAQEKQSMLTSRVNELEQEIVRLQNWNAEAQNYEILEFATGLFAYVARDNVQPLQSAHKLCTNCFGKQIKSLLQQQRIEVGRQRSLVCHRCNSNVVFRHYVDQT